MAKDFRQIEWGDDLEQDVRDLVVRMLAEDLSVEGDRTSQALIPPQAPGKAAVVVRSPGIVAGLKAAEAVLAGVDPRLLWLAECEDGQAVGAGRVVARIEGPAQAMLAAERPLLNLLGRLSGIASLTRRYVEAVQGTQAAVYDTRKTTPGLRLLEKYAVRCGGGRNHRTGLYDAVLIKDNHLAFGRAGEGGNRRFSPAEAVQTARKYLLESARGAGAAAIVEIEVDSLEQLESVLPAGPDIVLLDNMTPRLLEEAVARRDRLAPEVQLEASGGVSLETIGRIAGTGVERISVGALTHSATVLDVALDWID